MALLEDNVTAATADVDFGSIWINLTIQTTVPDIDFEPSVEEGWICLGDTMPDGFNFEQSADAKERKVMSKNLGSTFTNFADVLTVTFASSTDVDVLAVLFGKDNVTVTPRGAIQVAVKHRQPTVGSIWVKTYTDDGRPRIGFAPKARCDINLSYAWAEEDITGFETKFDLTAIKGMANHYELTDPVEGSVLPSAPEAARASYSFDKAEESASED